MENKKKFKININYRKEKKRSILFFNYSTSHSNFRIKIAKIDCIWDSRDRVGDK